MPAEPEECFRKGMTALKAGNTAEALAQFQTAVTEGKHRASLRSRMHYLSYYGLSMALAHRPSDYAIGACAKAAAVDPFDLALQHNLATVYVLAKQPTKALAVLEKALRLHPNNKQLRAELARLDRRRRPPVPRLHRNHPVNRWLGRLRASVVGPPSA
jgi:tetratricopeptide (TPR) repeat protein